MKTTTEILQKMDKGKDKRKELKKIRQQRKKFEEEIKKPQNRRIELIEYEDGTYSLKGYAYNLPLQRDEVEFAIKAWMDNLLENGVTLNEESKGGKK